MQLEGWKCMECGVVYAPFIKECRCSVKINFNYACIHDWPGPGVKCSKCGLINLSGSFIIDTPQQEVLPCQHEWCESGQSTLGPQCKICGALQQPFDNQSTGTKVTVSDLPDTIGRRSDKS